MDIITEPDNVVVLLSSYNGSKYIEEQIHSILTQKYSGHITVFIRDDCSSDDTLKIVQSIECPENREVRIFKDERHNIGPQRSFLKLIESAPEAAYYFLSDQDDVWKTDHVSSAVEILNKKSNAALYCSNYSLADGNLNVVKESVIEHTPTFTPLKAFFYNKIPGCCMAWNNELQKYLCQMHPENVMMHDRYIASFASFIGEVVYDPRSHILHRIHGDNVIGTGNKKIEVLNWIKEKSELLIKREDYDVCKMAEDFLRVGRTIAHPEYVKDIELLRDYRESRKKTRELLKHPDTSENNRGGGTQSTVYTQQDKVQAVLENTNLEQSNDVSDDYSACDLSIVCINNNDEILNRFLLPSIKKQVGVKYEVRIIDNCDNQYTGARKAFNEAAEVLKGKYIVFVHNDFCFNEPDAFQRVIHYCDTLEPFGIIGVAGCGNEKKKLIQTRIKQGKDRRSVGKVIKDPVSVMTVDECCFIVSRDRFMKAPFKNKDGWHLYAVEYCLQMLDMGFQNFVIPIDAWHYSDGISLNAAYCKEVIGLLENYSHKYPYINTTVKQWKTDFFTREFYLRYYAFKQNVKAKVVRK